MNAPPRKLPIPLVLVLLAGFAVGVLVERAGWMPGRRTPGDPSLRGDYAALWEAREKIQANFVNRDKTNDANLASGAINGMVNALDDRGHTAYLSKKGRERMREGLSGEIEGIGARVALVSQRATVVQVMPKSPARTAGVRAGDVLVAIDGQSTLGQTLQQVVNRLRGKTGSTVQLRLARVGSKNPLEMSVARQKVDVPEVSWHMLPGEPRVAHLTFQRFTATSSKQMHAVLGEIAKKDIAGLVFDMRGNSGGLKEQAIAIAAEFLVPDTVVLTQEDAAGKREEVRTGGDGLWRDKPMVVLVDGGSASSAEILAGALQDHERARIVGTRTYGTGTVLREFGLKDGSALLLAVSLWRTPKGRQIWNQGIQPDKDCLVALPAGALPVIPDDERALTKEEFARTTDKQLVEALARLRERMGAKEP